MSDLPEMCTSQNTWSKSRPNRIRSWSKEVLQPVLTPQLFDLDLIILWVKPRQKPSSCCVPETPRSWLEEINSELIGTCAYRGFNQIEVHFRVNHADFGPAQRKII